MSDMIFKNGRSMAAESMNWLHLKNVLDAVRMGDELFTHFPECLTHKCEGLPEPATSMANHGIAYYDHYNQLTLVEWGKIFLEWAHRKGEDIPPWQNAPDLYSHQASILEWMKEKERNAGKGDGWHKMELASGFVMYQHELGNIINQEMYDQYITEKPSGGIVAQAVGSGKTKEMLFLIRDSIGSFKKLGRNDQTLVVVPTTMISTWEDECKRWTPELKVCVYHGNRRKIPYDDDPDIVITTYRTVCSELSSNSSVV